MNKMMGHYYNIEPVVDYKGFVELFVLSFVRIEDNEYVARIPIDFRERIEDLMYSEHKITKFYSLIDSVLYYDRQPLWEKQIISILTDYLNNKNLKQEYDFNKNAIKVTFDKGFFYDRRFLYDSESFELMTKLTDYIDDNSLSDARNYELDRMDREKIIRRTNFK